MWLFSLTFAASLVFPREELCCIIELCPRYLSYFKALMCQIIRMSGPGRGPAV